jgi:hypothetical protein
LKRDEPAGNMETVRSELEKIVIGFAILLTFGLLGTLMAAFPHRTNEIRMRLPGQGDSPDWFIRGFGALMAVFSFVCAVLVIFLGH